MAWPLSQEYNEAVQNPRTSFADPDLKTGDVVPGPLGIPMPRSGNFADVYQIRGADGQAWALKCFTRPAVGLRERYIQIDAQLREARLPFSVGFEFLPEGVRIRGLWYPALKMEWVEGLQLNMFVRGMPTGQITSKRFWECGSGCASGCAMHASLMRICNTATSCSSPAQRPTPSDSA